MNIPVLLAADAARVVAWRRRQHPDELDVAAERDRLEAVLGLAAPGRPDGAAEADEVLRDLHAELLRRDTCGRPRAARSRRRRRRRTPARRGRRAAIGHRGGLLRRCWRSATRSRARGACPGVGGEDVVDGEVAAPPRVRRGPRRTRSIVGTMSVNRISPGEERLDAHLVGRVVDRRGGAAGARPPRAPAVRRGTPRRRAGRTPRSRGGSSRPPARRRAPGRGQPSPSAIGIIIDGGLACDQRRAVDELDHRVHHRGGVHDHLDPVERHAEEQVRLDDLEPLVDQGRGVDRDHRPHRPRSGGPAPRSGVTSCSSSRRAPPERPAAGGQHQAAYLVRRSRRAGTGRARCARSRPARSGPGCARAVTTGPPMISDSLLASARVVPGVERGERGPQPDRAGHAVEHDVAGLAGGLDRGLLAEPGERRRELGHLLLEQLGPAPAGGQPDDPEPVGVGPHHVEGLGADRAGRARGSRRRAGRVRRVARSSRPWSQFPAHFPVTARRGADLP